MNYEPKQFLREFIYSESEKIVYVNTTGDVELPSNENLTNNSFSSLQLNSFSFNFNIQAIAESTTSESWDRKVPVMTDIEYETNPGNEEEKIEDIRAQIARYLEVQNSAFFIITAIVTSVDQQTTKKVSSTINASSKLSID
jgi:hypothetical protein